MARLTVVKAVLDQDNPDGPPVLFSYGEDPLGFVTIQIRVDRGDIANVRARITATDLIRLAKVISATAGK